MGAEEEAVWGHRASMIADLEPAEAKAKEDEGSGDPLGTEQLGTEQDETVVQEVNVTEPSQAQRPQEAGPIWLKAFSKPMVRRHRVSSLSCFWSHCLMAWRVAPQPFLVPNPKCDGRRFPVISSEKVASWAFAVRRRRPSPTATEQ